MNLTQVNMTDQAQPNHNPVTVEVQYAVEGETGVDASFIRRWAQTAMARHGAAGDMCIRIVDREESAMLNETYRQKAGPTNVLSFQADIPAYTGEAYLGDLVVCAPVVIEQARQQGKALQHHWAHMVVHGVLHLLGYDHETADDARRMEQLEIAVLHSGGIGDPYADSHEQIFNSRKTGDK